MASYPRTIDKFKDHRDLIDDVEAPDINKIQDAVVNIERTLGRNPTRFETQESKNSGSGSVGGGEDPPPGYGQADRAVRTRRVDYDTVGDRLDALERGGVGGKGGNAGMPYYHLERHGVSFPRTTGNIGQRPPGFKLDIPNTVQDPYGLYNGYGSTLTRSGFWVHHASIVIHMTSNTDSDNYGWYNLAIDIDGEWLRGTNRQEHVSLGAGLVIVQAHRMGFANAGAKVTVRASHNAAVTQYVQEVILAGMMLKEVKTA